MLVNDKIVIVHHILQKCFVFHVEVVLTAFHLENQQNMSFDGGAKLFRVNSFIHKHKAATLVGQGFNPLDENMNVSFYLIFN